ncbi:hypothetical protein [Clostridium ihumii]|uniref:hypothetical protein n=1 Tax=Clostridium ihumii TaxID=1470356 RepID=UPI000ACABD65|nr:hypothetical protein [Clostridium ihumii]
MNKAYVVSKIQDCYKKEVEQFLNEYNEFTKEDKNYILDKAIYCYKNELEDYFKTI